MAGFAALNADEEQKPETLWKYSVDAAFPDGIRERIHDAISNNPQLARLFEDIAQEFLSVSQPLQRPPDPPPNPKKRKLEGDPSSQPPAQTRSNGSIQDLQTICSCKDVSFQIPMRKKLKLDIAFQRGNTKMHAIRLINQSTQEAEYTLSMTQIEQAFCLPVPDKQARQSNFVLYPKPGEGVEPIVFALNETAPPAGVIYPPAVVTEGETYVDVVSRELDVALRGVGLSLVRPAEAEFASSIPQSHRKGEKGFHIRAHRGSKEGYLFLLPVGIFFGFKKPLAFFPFAAIDSISYTSVLQRTLNLVVTTQTTKPDGRVEQEDVEFSMLDQADFAGIDDYVKRQGLNDASMAQARRAKVHNVNKPAVKSEDADGKVAGTGADGVGEDGLTDLQRAEQALQDAEDEEEEDYEASGGESEGEGSGSEEEDEGYEDGDGGGGEDFEGEEEEEL